MGKGEGLRMVKGKLKGDKGEGLRVVKRRGKGKGLRW